MNKLNNTDYTVLYFIGFYSLVSASELIRLEESMTRGKVQKAVKKLKEAGLIDAQKTKINTGALNGSRTVVLFCLSGDGEKALKSEYKPEPVKAPVQAPEASEQQKYVSYILHQYATALAYLIEDRGNTVIIRNTQHWYNIELPKERILTAEQNNEYYLSDRNKTVYEVLNIPVQKTDYLLEETIGKLEYRLTQDHDHETTKSIVKELEKLYEKRNSMHETPAPEETKLEKSIQKLEKIMDGLAAENSKMLSELTKEDQKNETPKYMLYKNSLALNSAIWAEYNELAKKQLKQSK